MGKLINILAILVLLNSCGTNKINQQFKFNSNKINIINKQIYNWQLSGKISWSHKPTNDNFICYVDWQKKYNKTIITFRSPMNIKNVTIESNGEKIKIINSSHNIKETQYNLENISETISLNLNNLNYWLLGIPNINSNYSLINNGFRQNNWDVMYSNYKLNNNLLLPSFIIMKNADTQTIIKIFISSLKIKN